MPELTLCGLGRLFWGLTTLSLSAVSASQGSLESMAFGRDAVAACSANVGNAMPRAEDMAAWIPKGGDGYDIIAVGMQEST